MGTLRSLDRRTVAICVCIAVVAAAIAGLVAIQVLADDGDDATAAPQEGFDLTPANEIEGDSLLTAPAETLDGAVTDLGALFVDQPMLVNFWQSTCAPCVEEMPLLEQLDEDPDLTVVGVATLDDLDRALELADETGITYPWVQDPTGMVFLAAEGAGMPTTVLLDEQGTVVASRTGAFTDLAELRAFVDENSG